MIVASMFLCIVFLFYCSTRSHGPSHSFSAATISLFNNLVPPSNLAHGCDYYMFKDGIKPAWEDPVNSQGGKWEIIISAREGATVGDLWLDTVLMCIGESFEHADHICGAVFNSRKSKFRISIWTRAAADEAAVMSIGNEWKAALTTSARFEYCGHYLNTIKYSLE